MTTELQTETTPFRGKAKNIPAQKTFLLPYQVKWVKDEHFLKIMEKSRRIGISYATAYRTIRKHIRKEQRLDTWVSSRDEVTAKLFIQDCKAFSKVINAAATDLGEKIIDKEKIHSIQFANNTELNSLASNPDVFAGKGGDVVLDEFALRKDPRSVYSIATPTIDWGGCLEIISTHRGSANYFNVLIKEIVEKKNPKNFSYHRVTLQDALDQGFLYKVQSKLRDGDPRLDMDEADYFNYIKNRAPNMEVFNQEYMCVPEDDNTAFLTYDLIATCELTGNDNLKIEFEETVSFAGKKGSIRKLWLYTLDDLQNLGVSLYLGVDVGRDHDLTVIWVFAKMLGMLITVAIIEMYNVEFERQEKELYAYLGLRYLMRACIDNTGIGKQFTERAQKAYGQYRVEACTFTAQLKEQLAYPVRMGFEDRSIRVPSDELITADLRAIKKENTVAGNIRFYADRGKNGHSDRFWALALAIHAATGSPSGDAWAVSGSPTDATHTTTTTDLYQEKIDYEKY